MSSNLAKTSTLPQRQTDQHLVVKGHCGLTCLAFGQKTRIYANFHQISQKQHGRWNDEVMALCIQKVKGQLWHQRVLWPLFNIVTWEQKGWLWPCFTFGQILNLRHWSWLHWMWLYRSLMLWGWTCFRICSLDIHIGALYHGFSNSTSLAVGLNPKHMGWLFQRNEFRSWMLSSPYVPDI